MAGESISIPILTPGADAAARNIKQVGDAAAGTGAKLDFAAGSLAAFDEAARKSAKADSTLVQARQAHAKADKLLADAENVLAGRATTTTKLFADQGRKLDDVGKVAGDAAGGFSSLAGTGSVAGGGMGAIIGISAALSPVIATIGTGVGGLAIAALGAGKNSKALAQDLAPLKGQVAAFQQVLQPTVLADFAKAAGLAGHVLHDIEPVTAATGKALAGVLGQVDATFQSGTWQQFFGFMERTAGPDVRLLGQNFTDLLQALPPLVEQLQPVSQDLLYISDATAKLIGHLAAYNQSISQTGQHENSLAQITDGLRKLLFSPGFGLLAALKLLHLTGGAAGKGLQSTAAGAAKAQQPVFNLDKAVALLNTDMTTLVGNLLTLQGDNVSWRQSMAAAKKQLDSNTAGLAGNSKNALANKQAVIASTNAAITFAGQQLTLKKNIAGASETIQAQIRFLQSLHDKSAFVRNEIAALRKEEAALAAQRVRQVVTVQASGHWAVVQGGGGRLRGPGAGGGFATGGRVPGTGSGDTVPAMLTPGEAVIPKRLVPAMAPFLKAGNVPGFAAGGIVPSYGGPVGGVWPWIKHNDAATIQLIDQAVVKATLAGIRAISTSGGAGVPGPGGGAPAANAALARRMYPPWATGAMWTAWNAVAMRESGWNQFARNPSSGAYGIPQALPPSKMGPAANPPQSNPAAQISWMIGYIRSRYGDPIGAYNHEQAFGWYDKGGFLPTGLSLAYNGTGRPEMVIPGGRGAGTTVVNNVTVQVGHGTHPVAAAQEIVKLLNAGAKSGVKLRTSILGPG